MTLVDAWLASRKEQLELTVEQVRSQDPTERGAIADCPVCGGPTRVDLDTAVRACDMHGPVDPVWRSYRVVEAA